MSPRQKSHRDQKVAETKSHRKKKFTSMHTQKKLSPIDFNAFLLRLNREFKLEFHNSIGAVSRTELVALGNADHGRTLAMAIFLLAERQRLEHKCSIYGFMLHIYPCFTLFWFLALLEGWKHSTTTYCLYFHKACPLLPASWYDNWEGSDSWSCMRNWITAHMPVYGGEPLTLYILDCCVHYKVHIVYSVSLWSNLCSYL